MTFYKCIDQFHLLFRVDEDVSEGGGNGNQTNHGRMAAGGRVVCWGGLGGGLIDELAGVEGWIRRCRGWVRGGLEL